MSILQLNKNGVSEIKEKKMTHREFMDALDNCKKHEDRVRVAKAYQKSLNANYTKISDYYCLY